MHLTPSLLLTFGLLGETFSHTLPPAARVGSSPPQQHVLGAPSVDAEGHDRPLSSLGLHQGRRQLGFVALGDSYSAGIGTGFEGKEDDCRHGLHAYPRLVAADLEASQDEANATSVQLLSCTGATTEEVLSGGDTSQIDSFNMSLPIDFALLSLGGNDLGFFEVMNSCVFRFYSFYSGTCESALENSRKQIESDEFAHKLRIAIMEILDKVRWEKKPRFTVTMTGYARFFNDVTDECNDMSFGVWWGGPRLTKDLRIRMNTLVKEVNSKIQNTVDMINSQFTTNKVLFVDYDSKFEGHRFCEPNVTEPDYERLDTWFFLVGGPDNARNGTGPVDKASARTLDAASSELADPSKCLAPAQRSGDWGQLALCYMAMAQERDPSLRPARPDIIRENSMWYVPTYYGKTFHPRARGHEAIRDSIYELWHRIDG